MAELCRVLHVTLLLYIFWLPSGTVDGKPKVPDKDYSKGETFIGDLLKNYFFPGCKAPIDAIVANVVSNFGHHGVSAGEQYITQLLFDYLASGCTSPPNTTEAMENKAFSAGEKRIIKILSLHFASGCDAEATEAIHEPEYTNGEKYVIDLLSSYFTSGCKDTIDASHEGVTSENAAVRHVKSIFLELFLLICAVCLTRTNFASWALNSVVDCMI